MTDVLIKRELLERIAAPLPGDNGWQTWHTQEMIEASKELRVLLDAPRQPEGELDVVTVRVCGYAPGLGQVTVQLPDGEFRNWSRRLELGEQVQISVNTPDAQRAIAELRGECERLRMQLSACGVVALANTPESAGEARQMHPDYMSASCSDVADAVDREMALRQQLAERDAEIEEWSGTAVQNGMECDRLTAQRDKLAGLLREADDWLCVLRQDGGYSRTKELSARIDTALAEVDNP